MGKLRLDKIMICKRSNKGTVIAEAAFILPLLLAVLFFIIEFGIVLNLVNNLNQIARSAARYAAVTATYTQQDLLTAANASSLVPDTSKLTLTISPTIGSTKNVGNTITVTTQYNYTPILNPYGLLILTMSSSNWAPVVKGAAVARAEVGSAG